MSNALQLEATEMMKVEKWPSAIYVLHENGPTQTRE